MACHLFGAKPLHEPMLAYCQLNSWEHTSVKFESEFYHFHSRQCNWKCHLPKWWPFCPRGIWVEQPWSIWANKSHKSWIKWKWILLNTQKHNLDIQSISWWNNTWAYSMGYTATAVPLKLTDITANLFNTLRPGQNGRHFPDDIFMWIFLNENVWISNNVSLKFVPKDPMNNIPSLVQIMAWRQPGNKPLSELMMVTLLTPIYVTQPQWVKLFFSSSPHGQNGCHFGRQQFQMHFLEWKW